MERMTKDFQYLEKEIKEEHQKFKEEIKEEIFLALAIQTRLFAIRSRHSLDGEKRYTP